MRIAVTVVPDITHIKKGKVVWVEEADDGVTPDSMATPCSVKALGSFRVPPQLDVPNWYIKFVSSFLVSTNMKSAGNLSMLRLTALIAIEHHFVTVDHQDAVLDLRGGYDKLRALRFPLHLELPLFELPKKGIL